LEKFQDGARTDLEARHKAVHDLVKPLRESLDKVDGKLGEIERQRVSAYSALNEQLKGLVETHLSMLRNETANLVKALRQPTVRGRWGEIQLRNVVASGLRGHAVSEDADNKRAEAQRMFEIASKAVEDKQKALRGRRIKGKDRDAAIELEVRPLEVERERRREAWLEALGAAVPRPELALGKRIDCAEGEYRKHAGAFLHGSKGHGDRDGLDLLAAFGSDACIQEKSDAIEPTPFQFITGSGHQYFLETVRQLIENVSPERVQRTLFEPWAYLDEGLSMRWDPVEDRRYALMDADPGPLGARTMWMANLLAYRSLALFPSAAQRGGLGVAGWLKGDKESAFTWPLWEWPASIDTIRSLLQLRELVLPNLDGPALRTRGVVGVFRARRIRFPPTGSNYKLNFTPARQIL
jgi:hypothetical protein